MFRTPKETLRSCENERLRPQVAAAYLFGAGAFEDLCRSGRAAGYCANAIVSAVCPRTCRTCPPTEEAAARQDAAAAALLAGAGGPFAEPEGDQADFVEEKLEELKARREKAAAGGKLLKGSGKDSRSQQPERRELTAEDVAIRRENYQGRIDRFLAAVKVDGYNVVGKSYWGALI